MNRSTIRLLLVATLFLIAGCQGPYGQTGATSDPRAVEAVNQARQTSLNVTSYRYTIDGHVKITRNSQARTIALTGEGIVNAERQRVNLTVRSRGDTRVGHRHQRVAYVDNYTLDVACSRLGWARQNLSPSTNWFNYSPLGQQFVLLDRTNVYWNGTEMVNGVKTAVVIAHPTKQQLQTGGNLPTNVVSTEGGASIKNATVRVWIDTETNRIRKLQREIHVRGNGATGIATLTYRFSDYNEPTNITRPSFNRYGPRRSDCPNQ